MCSVSPTNTTRARTPVSRGVASWLEGRSFCCRRLTFSTVPNRSATRRNGRIDDGGRTPVHRRPRGHAGANNVYYIRRDVALCVQTRIPRRPVHFEYTTTVLSASAVSGSLPKGKSLRYASEGANASYPCRNGIVVDEMLSERYPDVSSARRIHANRESLETVADRVNILGRGPYFSRIFIPPKNV